MPLDSLENSTAGLCAAKCQLHAGLVQVFGAGILLSGDSGVGKTRCAIELVRRGHSIVTDDAVQIFEANDSLFGSAPSSIRSFIHIRGVGIRRFEDLFDTASFIKECRIDLSIDIGFPERSDSLRDLNILRFNIEAIHPAGLADRVESIARDYLSVQA